jgi:hypothetical protein
MSKNALRGMRDLRSMRNMPSFIRRSGSAEGSGAYVDMLRLSTEKARLERELTMWQAHTQRCQTRLAEIQIQMQQLSEITARDRTGQGENKDEVLQEMTLSY